MLKDSTYRFATNEEAVTKEMLAWGVSRLEERAVTSRAVSAVSRGIVAAGEASTL